ncbi:hypothetical protein [Thermoanaerobacter uzonensis]|uniref:hypothetical protein n=1 Tax=Thermoanaerobacter uzonensis TaxID=447593 RepID=UPI003D76859F
MRKILALAIVIALAVAGYQVYKDDNKRMVLEEKVKGVLYSIGTGASRSFFYGPGEAKERVDLQPMVDEYAKKYYDKEISFNLKSGTILSGKIKNIKAIEYTVDVGFYKKGDIILLGEFIIDSFKSPTLPKKVLNFTDNKVFVGKAVFQNGKVIGKDVEKTGKPFILGIVDDVVRDILIADEVAKYIHFDSHAVKFLMSDRILIAGSSEGTAEDGKITAKISNKFDGRDIYIISSFKSKDGYNFYETKRESNIREYVEWAKKNL